MSTMGPFLPGRLFSRGGCAPEGGEERRGLVSGCEWSTLSGLAGGASAEEATGRRLIRPAATP